MPHKTDLPRWQDRLMIACCSAVAAGALATRRQHWVVIDYTCNTCSSVESRSRGHWQPSDDGRNATVTLTNHKPSLLTTRQTTARQASWLGISPEALLSWTTRRGVWPLNTVNTRQWTVLLYLWKFYTYTFDTVAECCTKTTFCPLLSQYKPC